MNIYTTEYLNNATSSRYYISDRDVSDEMILPYTWHDIKIKPNDLVTAHTINGSISKLYDNLLYIISQSMTPQSLIPSKSGFDTVIATIEAGVDGLSAIRSWPYYNTPTLSLQTTHMEWMDTGIFLPTVSGVDCGVLFTDDGSTASMTVLRDDDTGSNMAALDSTDRIDNFTNRTFRGNSVATIADALELTSIGNSWYSPGDWFFDASGVFWDPDATANWIFVPDGKLGPQWMWCIPTKVNGAWLFSEALGWIWVTDTVDWIWMDQPNNSAGSIGWIWIKETVNGVALLFNDTDQKWYNINWSNSADGGENTTESSSPPEFNSGPIPTFGTPTTKFDTFDNLLYMLNPGSNNIFKFDISGLTQHDNSYFDPSTNIGGKILLDIIGGVGNADEDVKFESLKTFSIDPTGNLYVVDTSDTDFYIKKYDVNTNHVSTNIITTDISSETPIDLAFVKDRFYLLTNVAVHEFSTALTHLRRWQLKNELDGTKGEVYRSITPSKENENVVYISTTLQVFKKFISKLDAGIGKFVLTGRNMNIQPESAISFVSTVAHGDVEHVYVGDQQHGIIYKFVESSDYQRILNTSFESRFVPLNDISIKREEFVTNVVYNKAMAKLFYNHALVSHSIVSRLISEYAGTKTRKFKTLQYILQEYVTSRSFGTKPKLGNFVGINEMLLSAVINRTLEKIFDFQLALLKDIDTSVIDNPSYVDTLPITPTDVASLKPEDKYAYVDGKWTTEDKLED